MQYVIVENCARFSLYWFDFVFAAWNRTSATCQTTSVDQLLLLSKYNGSDDRVIRYHNGAEALVIQQQTKYVLILLLLIFHRYLPSYVKVLSDNQLIVKLHDCTFFWYYRKMADVKSLEHPTLKVILGNRKETEQNWLWFFKVPYEILNKKFRTTQKVLDREVSHITQAANEIEKAVSEEDVKTKDITMLLGGMVEKLQVK